MKLNSTNYVYCKCTNTKSQMQPKRTGGDGKKKTKKLYLENDGKK